MRLASQLIGWQIDLYGSREWLERGADEALFGASEPEYEMADFPLSELDIEPGVLAALSGAGYTTFLDIIDLEREDFLRIEGIDAGAADALVGIIEELTVVEDTGSAETPSGQPTAAELAEAREVAAEILGLDPGGKSVADDRG